MPQTRRSRSHPSSPLSSTVAWRRRMVVPPKPAGPGRKSERTCSIQHVNGLGLPAASAAVVDRPALRPYRIFPNAEADLASALDSYEGQASGLGLEFLRAFEAALAMLRRYPEAAPRVRGAVRRAVLRRFPFGVFFDERDGTIRVLAVLHARRDPANRPRGRDA